MVINLFNFLCSIIILTLKVCIYIIHSTLSSIIQPLRNFACPSRPPIIPPDDLPSIQPTPLPLCLTRAVRPQERVTLPLCRLFLRTWINLVQKNIQVILIYQPYHCLTAKSSYIYLAIATTALIYHERLLRHSFQHCSIQ